MFVVQQLSSRSILHVHVPTCSGRCSPLLQVKQQKSRGEEGVKKWVKETEDLLKRHSPHSTSHKSTSM